MKAFINSTFWGDPDIERQKAGVKLCALWLFSNTNTSPLGVCEVSEARFCFETGLPAEALQSTLQALPRCFMKIGNAILIRNFIRHQFGSGEKLVRNNYFVSLKSEFNSISDPALKAEILIQCPEFGNEENKGFKGGSNPQGKERIGKDRIGKEKKGSGRENKNLILSIPESLKVDGFGDAWERYVQHRREIRKPLTQIAAEGILKTLAERPHQAVFALELAPKRGWQGIEWAWIDKDRPAETPKKKDYRIIAL